MLSTLNIKPESMEMIQMDGFKGCIGAFNNKSLNYLKTHSDVNYVEEEAEIKLYNINSPSNDYDNTENNDEHYNDSNEYQQSNPQNWGLSRISFKGNTALRALNNVYKYPRSAGAGVTVYVIDTGVTPNTKEFGNRLKLVKNYYNNIDRDENGHGSHVSGIIGSMSYGVAKNATIHGIKVFGANGGGSSTLSIVKAIQYVIQNRGSGPSVINMSLGGGKSLAIEDAVKQAYMAGIPVIVAAGNESSDACTYSPSGSKYAFAVGNTDKDDKLHASSNYGKCVRINAPGTNIMSTYKTGTKLLTGTSMASPHVAGVAALYLADSSKGSVKELYNQLMQSANQNAVKTVKSTRGLLYNMNTYLQNTNNDDTTNNENEQQ